MEWPNVIIVALFVVGVLLAFPLAIGIVVVLGGMLVTLDRLTECCPGFAYVRRWYRRRRYRPGRIVFRFVAPDVQRDVEIVDASAIDAGLLTVRTRTWNVLYVIKGLSSEPGFGEVRTVALSDLWAWSGGLWGGPATEGDKTEQGNAPSGPRF
jgi:hypothetical protein